MRRFHLAIALVAATSLTLPLTARGLKRIVPATAAPSTAAPFANVIVVGKVVKLETDMEEHPQFPGQAKVPYRVAEVKIEQTMLGAKGLTKVRIGFPANAGAGYYYGEEQLGGLDIRSSYLPANQMALEADQEGCFVLERHPSGDFYIAVGFTRAGWLNKKDANYAEELKKIEATAKVIKDPETALKAEKPEQVNEALNILGERFRNPNRPGMNREVALDKETSKVLMHGMTKVSFEQRQVHLQKFFGVEVTKFTGSGTTTEMNDRQVKFLNDNAGKIELKRFDYAK